MIQILGLMGMYFDAVVVEVKTFLLLFRFTLAILCYGSNKSTGKKLAKRTSVQPGERQNFVG